MLANSEREFAQQVVNRLRDAGFEALWAGGCVRDLLLGLEPCDYDVATNAHPKNVRQLFGHAQTLAVGAAFGVILVQSTDRRFQVEVATFRTDANYSDGRHPDSVTFSTPELDAQRRDFTINGLFYDPIACQVIDFVGGQRDLADRVLRAIGDPQSRISEDRLRMFRAVRFAARFDLRIADSTFAAIAKHSSEATSVSGERLAMELRKTLETARSAWAVEQWAETGLLRILLPEVDANWSQRCPRVLAMLRAVSNQGWQARLAAVLWAAATVGDETARSLANLKSRLRFSNDEIAAIRFAIQTQHKLQQANELPWSQVQPLMVSTGIVVAVELLELRVAVAEAQSRPLNWIKERLLWPEQVLNPPPLVDGRDLMAQGLKPSPKFKQLLQTVRDMQLDQQLLTKCEAIHWIKSQM